jgi:hypothetical protein
MSLTRANVLIRPSLREERTPIASLGPSSLSSSSSASSLSLLKTARRPVLPGVVAGRGGERIFFGVATTMNDLTPIPRTQGGRRPGAGRPRKTQTRLLAPHPGDEAIALNFESPAPPLTSGRAARLTYHMLVNVTRRQDRMEGAIERIATVLDSVDYRLARLEANHA